MKRGDKPAANEPIPGAREVSQAYGALPNAEVPPELDARVLAHARGATDKSGKVVSLAQARLRRWAVPLSTAASVLVVMSVVYEMQFNTPNPAQLQAPIDTKLIEEASPEQDASASLEEEHAPATAGNSRQAALEKPVAPAANEMADAARGHAIAPPPPMVAPSIAPVIVTFPESASLAPQVSLPLPSPAPSAPAAAFSESTVMANASREEKKEQEIGAAADKAAAKVEAERSSSAMIASGQLQALAAKRAAAQAALPDLKLIAGRYTYQSYRLVTLSGERMGLKELGYATATLDIDASGTLTRRMTAADGKVTTQTATVLEAKLADGGGRWTILWSDLGYPIEATLLFDANKLTSRAQFEQMSDADHFGNVEFATLQRIGDAGR